MNIHVQDTGLVVWGNAYIDGRGFTPQNEDDIIEHILNTLKYDLYYRYRLNNLQTFQQFERIHRSRLIIRNLHTEDSWALNNGQLTRLIDITIDSVLQGFENIHQSNADINIFNIEIGFTLLQQRPRGFGQTKMPEYISTRLKNTWTEQRYNNRKIACGAFAIAYQIVSRPNQNCLAQRRALQLMDEFVWGEGLTANDLARFVDHYKDYRLTIILPALMCYEPTTFKGSDYVYEEDTNGKITKECLKKTLYIVYDPVTKHYGCTQSPAAPRRFMKNSHSIKFCHKCVSCFTVDCNCLQKPLPNITTFKKCFYCKQTPCQKSGCNRNCENCGVQYEFGYGRNENKGF